MPEKTITRAAGYREAPCDPREDQPVGFVGTSASSEFSAAVRLLIAVVSGPVPPAGLSRFVSEQSRSPRRPPPGNWLGIASMRTLIRLVRTTRPSTLSVIGLSLRLRTWQEFGRLGSACAVVAP